MSNGDEHHSGGKGKEVKDTTNPVARPPRSNRLASLRSPPILVPSPPPPPMLMVPDSSSASTSPIESVSNEPSPVLPSHPPMASTSANPIVRSQPPQSYMEDDSELAAAMVEELLSAPTVPGPTIIIVRPSSSNSETWPSTKDEPYPNSDSEESVEGPAAPPGSATNPADDDMDIWPPYFPNQDDEVKPR